LFGSTPEIIWIFSLFDLILHMFLLGANIHFFGKLKGLSILWFSTLSWPFMESTTILLKLYFEGKPQPFCKHLEGPTPQNLSHLLV
jgi:hypothetical protein